MRCFLLIFSAFLCKISSSEGSRVRNNFDDWDENGEDSNLANFKNYILMFSAIYLKCGLTTDEEIIILTNPSYPRYLLNQILNCN